MLLQLLTMIPRRYLISTSITWAVLLLLAALGCGGNGAASGAGGTRSTPSATRKGTTPSASTTTSTTTSSGPPARGRIAYACGDPPQICVINADGTGMRQLTYGGYHQSPTWSPDGTILAFTGAPTAPGHSQIYMMEAAGGKPARVSHGGGNKASLDWSANGTLLVAADDRHGNFDLYLFDPSGRVREKQLTRGPGDDIDPDWAPDGTSVVYTRVKGRSFPTVMVTRRDGNDSFEVTEGMDPAWSPDETELAVATAEGILVVPGKGEPHLLTDQPFDNEPTWSPDGTQLAFRRGRVHEDAEIYVINIDGTGLRQLTHGSGEDVLPAWSPQ